MKKIKPEESKLYPTTLTKSPLPGTVEVNSPASVDIYNGAPLIGLNGISVKSHGNANPLAFSYALKQCHNFITNDLNKQIIKSIKNI